MVCMYFYICFVLYQGLHYNFNIAIYKKKTSIYKNINIHKIFKNES